MKAECTRCGGLMANVTEESKYIRGLLKRAEKPESLSGRTALAELRIAKERLDKHKQWLRDHRAEEHEMQGVA